MSIRRPEPPAVDRAGAGDLAYLAMDTGPVPEQFGAILVLDGPATPDLPEVRRLLEQRIRAVPRLRQRLVRTLPGCGGPVWVDDPSFEIRRHLREVRCATPGDEDFLLATALSAVMTPLPRDAPLWGAVLVTGLAADRAALVLVLHHVLSDGVGGLAVLANLVDPGPPAAPDQTFPRPRPTGRALAVDAMRRRLAAVRRAPTVLRLLRRSMAAGGGLHPPRAVSCSLVRRTGPRRRLAVVRVDLDAVRNAAHRAGATVNDAVLVAVAGALHRVLLGRGEAVDSLVVTVPVSGRGRPGAAELGHTELGNMVSPLLVPVPTTGDVAQRLAEVAAVVRAGKEAATAPPPIALLGWLFRPLARFGGYHWYMNHQHRFHTLVSHVRGPDEPLTFAGARIGSAVPVGVAEGGNVTVYFEVLSYARVMSIGVVVDPDHFPDLPTLVRGLQEELALVAETAALAG